MILTQIVSLYHSLTLKENIVAVITQDKVIDNNLKKENKNQTLCTCRLFLLIQSFQYDSMWSILAFTHHLCSIYIANIN